MLPGKVIGKAISTVKHESLRGERLLVVQPLRLDGVSPEGFPQLALDRLGAGIGDRVLLTSDGSLIAEMVSRRDSPARWSVMGILDR